MSRLLVSPQYNPYLNLAVENGFLAMPADGEVTFYLWQNRRTVVIGQNQNPYAECDVSALEADGGHLMRRRSGGGAVYHDLGNLNFTFIAPCGCYDVGRQFSVIRHALASFGLAAEVSGRNDLLCDGRKISGSAFSKGRTLRLHHGTLLLRTDVDALQRYLKPNPTKLQKHGVASVRSRVANVTELLSERGDSRADLSIELLLTIVKERLVEAFASEYGVPETLDWNTHSTQAEVQRLCEELASPEWIYGRWKEFQSTKCGQFGWGGVEVALAVDQSAGRILKADIASDSLCPEAIAQAQTLLANAGTQVPPPIPSNIEPNTPNYEIIRDILSILY